MAIILKHVWTQNQVLQSCHNSSSNQGHFNTNSALGVSSQMQIFLLTFQGCKEHIIWTLDEKFMGKILKHVRTQNWILQSTTFTKHDYSIELQSCQILSSHYSYFNINSILSVFLTVVDLYFIFPGPQRAPHLEFR